MYSMYQRNDILNKINPTLLVTNPKKLYDNLKFYNNKGVNIRDFINNDGDEKSWYSSLPTCLFYLVGDLDSEDYGNFYGSDIKIQEDFGILLMDELVKGGADLSIKNYYDRTLLDCIKEEESGLKCVTTRKNNKKFLDYVINLY